MAEELNVLVICGSLRKNSYNAALTRALPALAPPEMKLIPAPADAIRAADGVLFVTPEYNFSMPGGLKNAIDWVSRLKDQPFVEKPVAIQSCSGGPVGGARMQYHWRMTMTFLKANIFGTPEIFIGNEASKFDPQTLELTDQPTREFVKMQLAAFAKFVVKMKR
jgi:chromate reductase